MALPIAQALPGGGQQQLIPRFGPEQSSALSQLLQQGLQTGVGPQVERAKKGFYEQTIPSLAERFTAMGGGQKSSAFQGAIGQAGADLESQLEALRSQYGMQQLQLGLTPQYESAITPPSPGFGTSLGAGLGAALPQLGELGIKHLLGGLGKSQVPQALGGAAGQAAASAGGGLGLSGLLKGLGTAGAAAAPFALPALGAAGVIALPLLLHKLLE